MFHTTRSRTDVLYIRSSLKRKREWGLKSISSFNVTETEIAEAKLGPAVESMRKDLRLSHRHALTPHNSKDLDLDTRLNTSDSLDLETATLGSFDVKDPKMGKDGGLSEDEWASLWDFLMIEDEMQELRERVERQFERLEERLEVQDDRVWAMMGSIEVVKGQIGGILESGLFGVGLFGGMREGKRRWWLR